jgi:hypothetical protein
MRGVRLSGFALFGALALTMAPVSVSFAAVGEQPAAQTEAEQIAAATASIKAALDALPADASKSDTLTAINNATASFGLSIVTAALKSLIGSGAYAGEKLAGLTSAQDVALALAGQNNAPPTGGIPAFLDTGNGAGGTGGGVTGAGGSYEYRK